MGPDLTIRQATREDAEAIGRVHVGTWQAAYSGLIPKEFLDALSIAKRASVWREWLGEGLGPMEFVRVAERGEQVVGFVNAGSSRDEDASEVIGELRAIYVLSEHWDSGAGGALMSEALDWLRTRYREATLWVIDGNVRARRFYERFRWFFDGTEKKDDSRGFVLNEVRYRIAFADD
ncbi:MAG: GNAT family N-acetyltransferase [Actinomycetota bacterium]